MKNPFKPDHSDQDRDNPVVPNAVEQPVERAAERAARYDNPLIPNAIERPVERAVADRDVTDRPGIGERSQFDDDRGTRRGITDDDPDIGRRRTASAAPTIEASSPGTTDDTRQMDLFPEEELLGYRTQWESIQTGFVDQPRAAVEHADALVSQLVNRLTEVFTRERSMLEGQWTKGDNVSTEDLRIALTRYRSFFHRLLSM